MIEGIHFHKNADNPYPALSRVLNQEDCFVREVGDGAARKVQRESKFRASFVTKSEQRLSPGRRNGPEPLNHSSSLGLCSLRACRLSARFLFGNRKVTR
jgi:hypothetical protein